jgi:hypothetical protein
MIKQRVVCQLLNDTPGALRYRQTDSKGNPIKGDTEGALVGDLYLRKAAIPEDAPQKITVTIEY